MKLLFGHVVAEGRKTGVPTPVSAVVVEVVREVEAGTREPRPQNIEQALRCAGL